MKSYMLCIMFIAIFISNSVFSLEVTLTLHGSIEDIAKVIEVLRQSGLGNLSGQSGEDPFRIHIYSSSEEAKEELKETLLIGFQEIITEPLNPIAGTSLKIMAKVIDSSHTIDTISANLFGSSINTDLKDDGQNGDETAGDGTWTGIINLPADVYGDKTLILTAFDKKGKIIQTKTSDGTLKPIIGTYDFIIQLPGNK